MRTDVPADEADAEVDDTGDSEEFDVDVDADDGL